MLQPPSARQAPCGSTAASRPELSDKKSRPEQFGAAFSSGNSHGVELLSGLFGIVFVHNGNSGEKFRLGFVGGEIVDSVKKTVGNGLERCGIEYNRHTVFLSKLFTLENGLLACFKLHNEHVAVLEILLGVVNLGGGQLIVGVLYNDDAVVSVVVDFDKSRAGSDAFVLIYIFGGHFFALIVVEHYFLKKILAGFGNHKHLSACAGGGCCLVVSLSARAEFKLGSEGGFSHNRKMGCICRNINNKASYNHYFTHNKTSENFLYQTRILYLFNNNPI